MRVRVCILVTLILAATTTACGAASNPLIGKWKYTGKGYVDRAGSSYCGDVLEMEFTPRELIQHSAATGRAPAATSRQTVNYLVNGKKVYVSSTQSFGSGQYWSILDARTIESDTVGACVFARE